MIIMMSPTPTARHIVAEAVRGSDLCLYLLFEIFVIHLSCLWSDQPKHFIELNCLTLIGVSHKLIYDLI